jgi:hypothetical protein
MSLTAVKVLRLMSETKKCFKCRQTLPKADFYAHKMMGDGLLGKCKGCTKRDVKENRESKSDYYRSKDAERAMLPHRVEARRLYLETQAGKLSANRAKLKYRGRNPIKYKATNAVNNAVRDGRLLRQDCIRCGAKAQAHHEDYEKPLEVTWLCPKHHKERHAEMGKAADER